MDNNPGAWSTFTSPSSDVWKRTMTTATASSDDGWFASMVFRLACAFWFVVGAAFGRATSGWFGGGDHKRVRDASTSTAATTAVTAACDDSTGSSCSSGSGLPGLRRGNGPLRPAVADGVSGGEA